MEKRGISPVIATVLLIAVVLVIATVIFIWASGSIGEQITKNGRAADLVCDDVDLSVFYFSGELEVTNRGNIPIAGIKVKGEDDLVQCEGGSLAVGRTVTFDVDDDCQGISDVEYVVPVIQGVNDEGSDAFYTCDDNEFGV
jgi:flagellin-like protein